jgi:hypothetical protein
MSLTSDLSHIGNTQNKTDRIQYIGFPRSVQAGDRIERRIPSRDCRAHWVRLETYGRGRSASALHGSIRTVRYHLVSVLLSASFVVSCGLTWLISICNDR